MGFETCAKIILVVVNIIFTLIGLALTAAGVVLRFFPQVYEPYLDDLKQLIPTFSSDVGIEGVTASSTTDEVLDLGSLFSTVGIALLVFGIFVTIVGILGLFGACCTVKCMLIVYAIIVVVLLLAKLVVLIIVVTGYFNDQIREEANKTLVNNYGGIDDFGIQSLSWNYVMLEFECCGLDSYEDFTYAKNWNKIRNVTIDGNTFQTTFVTPAACCKTVGTFPTSSTPLDSNCTFTPTDVNNNWKTGCWDALNEEYKTQQTAIYGIFAAILVFEFLCVLFAVCIICRSEGEGKFV